MASYELWEERTRRIVGRWSAEADALAVVRDLLDRGEVLAVAALVLRTGGWEGSATIVAAGVDLARRARQETDETAAAPEHR